MASSDSGQGVASQSLGATLSAVMCGGALEILLLATACGEFFALCHRLEAVTTCSAHAPSRLILYEIYEM